MKKIHTWFIGKSKLYALWHNNIYHQVVHWLAFVVISGFLALSIFNALILQYEEAYAGVQYKKISIGALFVWQTPAEVLSSGLVKSSGLILELQIAYDAEGLPPLKFMGAQKRTGYAPKYDLVNIGYTLQLLDPQLAVLDSLMFTIPNVVDDPPPQDGEKLINQSQILKRMDFILTIPWKEKAAIVQILSPEHEVIASTSVLDLPTIPGKQNFRSIPGHEFLKGKSLNLFKQYIPTAHAATGDTLDIAFVGDDYLTTTALGTFHNDVNRFVNHLLTYEPFRSRASQILFHFVDNTSDLGCVYSGRLITCNNSKVSSVVNASGAPYDKIVVIVNNSTYGGSGGYTSVAYNGSQGHQVFVHEFGHSLGGLIDEYNLYSGGVLDNKIHVNCYGGNPPASGWANLVAVADYALGCNYPNWYRSFPNSIMINLSYPYFNAVSQAFINSIMNYYSSPFSDGSSPTSVITYPAGGSTVSGAITISSALSDNNGIARAELWKDGVLFRSSYRSPYSFSWSTTYAINGIHTLEVRAYDVAGNVGSSGIISVTVNNATSDVTSPTVSISSPASGSTVSGLTTVSATASDNSGTVSKVDLFKDGIFFASDNVAPFSFPWDTTKETNSPHTLQTKAYDPSNNIGSSATLTVTANNIAETADIIGPSVLITSPTNGSTVARRATLTLSASASDDIGVAKVEFYINDALTCTDTTAGYSCSWQVPGTPKKTYQIQARALDAAGNAGVSTISITSK